MDDSKITDKELVQLARLALAGKPKDVQTYVRRLANRYRSSLPELSDALGSLLRHAPDSATSALRRGTVVDAIPVDLDSRLQLARPIDPVELEVEPIWDERVREQLEQLIFERNREEALHTAGLHPTKSAIFTGPPGVGKTLAAKWIAQQLKRPLIILDLSAVMSSFLGRTGNNVRNILDYARGVDCVFFLDEFDAIAKRRDDVVEVGELKRLVTVLLQEIDNWPSSGLLLAATNHDELLDPAVWRRFEMIVKFPMPNAQQVNDAIVSFLKDEPQVKKWAEVLAIVFEGMSFAEIERELLRVRRHSTLHDESVTLPLRRLVQDRARELRRDKRSALAVKLVRSGLSQREAHEWTGVSRDTIRKAEHQH